MAEYKCPICGDRFRLDQDDRREFPDQWHLTVVHNHDGEEPLWEAALYYRVPRGRYPPEAKAVGETRFRQQSELRQEKKEAAPLLKNPPVCGKCIKPIDATKIPYVHECGRWVR